MLNAGLSAAALASAVGVEAKSVSRWVMEDRVPRQPTRADVARVLRHEETFLFPMLLESVDPLRTSVENIEQVWPARSAITSETWHALFAQASKQIDLQVYAGAFLIETLDLKDVLEWKASRGTRVRLLVGDPNSAAVQQRAAELATDWLPARCRSTFEYASRIVGIGVRTHAASHYASIFRFDDTVLVNTHAFGAWACHSPVHQVLLAGSGRLFEFWRDSFERAWIVSGSRQVSGSP